MSLYVPSDGILKTHVTWKEVEHEMKKSLSTDAQFGPNKKAISISDMKGFMSKIALIEPDWIHNHSNEDLPKKFVLKMSSQLALVEMGELMDSEENLFDEAQLEGMAAITREFHNREVQTYRMLQRYGNEKVPITKIYATKMFDEDNQLKGYIISEYIPELQHIAMHDCISEKDIRQVIRAVTAFSALGEKLPEEALFYARKDLINTVLQQFFNEKGLQQSEELLLRTFAPEYHEKVRKYIQIYREFYMKPEFMDKYIKAPQFLGHKPVLVHCDLWSSNLLCQKKDDNVVLKAIIDFQTVSIGCPGQDVGRLFVCCLSKKDRREKVEELIEYYYDCFVKELEGKQAPYTLEQLKDSYYLFLPIMTMMVLPGIAPLLERADIPEEYRESVKEAAMDKMIGLLEDTIATHERIFKKYPSFFI